MDSSLQKPAQRAFVILKSRFNQYFQVATITVHFKTF
jgi:hypothetical protein